MTILDSLVVNLLMDSRKFEAGAKGGAKQLGVLDREVKSLNRTFKKLQGGLNSVAGMFGVGIGISAGGLIGGAVAFGKSQLELAKHLDTTSKRIGETRQELEFYRFAADRANIGTNVMEMALQRMTRRIQQAAQGTGEAKKVLELYNLDAKELNRLSPSEQFRKIATELQRVNNVDFAQADAMAFFDSEGVDVLNVARMNLSQLRREFEMLGGAMSDEQIDQLLGVADKFTNLGQRVKALGRGLLADVTPAAVAWLDQADKLVQGLRPFLQRVLDTDQASDLNKIKNRDLLREEQSRNQTRQMPFGNAMLLAKDLGSLTASAAKTALLEAERQGVLARRVAPGIIGGISSAMGLDTNIAAGLKQALVGTFATEVGFSIAQALQVNQEPQVVLKDATGLD